MARRDYGEWTKVARRLIEELRDTSTWPSGFNLHATLEMFKREAGLPHDLSEVVQPKYRAKFTAGALDFAAYEYWIMQVRTAKDYFTTGSGRRVALRAFVWLPNGSVRQGHYWQRRAARVPEIQAVTRSYRARQRAGKDLTLAFEMGAPLMELIGPQATWADVEDRVLKAM